MSGDYQSKLTLMSESLRNDGRVWVPLKKGDKRPPNQIPEAERDYYLERRYPSFGNLVPRDVASRNAKTVCDEGRGVGERASPSISISATPFSASAPTSSRTATAICSRCTSASPAKIRISVPMRIYPAIHYTMGGLWVDYNLMTTIPGLYVVGEANFSDHGANRLGASALMQGLADGYFVLPNTINDYIASSKLEKVDASHPAVREAERGVASLNGSCWESRARARWIRIHRELGKMMWDYCGMSRTAEGLKTALGDDSRAARAVLARREGAGHGRGVEPVAREGRPRGRFLRTGRADVPATRSSATNPAAATSAKSIRRRMARRRATTRTIPTPPPGNSAARGNPPELHNEPLEFEYVHPAQRSYK